nr:cytochrome c-type biogenesis CcmF C-terminal domain-containing protein [Wolbachia endosymbiont of Atemnus politus]
MAGKKESYLKIGDSITINKFKVTLRNIEFIKEKNFHAVKGTMDIRNLLNNKVLGRIAPEYRFYLVEGLKNVESSIYHNLFSDIYVAIGEIDKSKSKIATKVHYKPGIPMPDLARILPYRFWLTPCCFFFVEKIVNIFLQLKQ